MDPHPDGGNRAITDLSRPDPSGCRFRYAIEGSGPRVVFIQGVGLHGRGWTPQVAELRSDFECLILDNRGMGESQPVGGEVTVERMAADTLWLMDELGWESAHVVGHSLGGLIAIEMALASRGRVRSLSLLCTVARGRDATRLSWPIVSLGLRGSVGTLRSRRRAFLRLVMPKAVLRDLDMDRLAKDLEPLFGHDLAVRPPIVMKQLAALRSYDAAPRLRTLAGVPTLVVSAMHDLIAPPRYGRGLAEGIPGARYLVFDDAAHGLPIQHPARLNQLLRDHVLTAEADRAQAP